MHRRIPAIWLSVLALALLALSLPHHLVSETSYEISPKHRVLEEVLPGTDALEVGEPAPAFTLKTLDGAEYTLDQLRDSGPVVLEFLSSECPVAQRYAVRLNRLHNEFTPRGLQVFGIAANAGESWTVLRQHAADMSYAFSLVWDAEGKLARQLGATMTPQVLLFDTKGRLRYRGAIDDNRYENRVKHHYLRDAIVALLDDESVAVPEAPAFGCTIHLPEEQTPSEATYAEHIAPLIQRNCQPCHRPGEVAPFSLLSYSDARQWSTEIAYYTAERFMPPWKPEPGFGAFQHERRLTDEEIVLIQAWDEAGAPLGDLAMAPPPMQFPEGWVLGEPDLLVQMQEPYEVGPEGEDEYRHFIIPTQFETDHYVEAVDVEPGNRQTVHHVIIYLDTKGNARKLDAADPGPGYTTSGAGPGFDASGSLGGWAPGKTPTVLPEGTGYHLPKGADIVLQIHYYRTGRVETDQSKVAVYFSDAPDPKPVHIGEAINTDFVIPAGDPWYLVEGEHQLRQSIYVLAVMPHMHLLGRDMRMTATLPDESQQDLIWISDWDFNWQDAYHYREPLYLPQDTRIRFAAHFDNSPDNPLNPHHPPKPVGWGEKTTDEMAIAFFHYVNASYFPSGRSQAAQ